ncbi:MAG: hypothetical protein QOF33_445 [Thermomicrobiales bacterium]|nr:hypothetical protein [Thermomicrobiales bacterium]
MQDSPFRKVERFVATDAVRDQLTRSITSGELKVGTKLPPEHELARTFGVSRTVVREALGSLKGMGLVVTHVGRGTFVQAFRPNISAGLLGGRFSAGELHEVRSHLEIPAAALAARCRSNEDLEHLRSVVDAQAECDDPVEWVTLDMAFHRGLAKATGNRVLETLIEDLGDLQMEQSLALASMPGRLASGTREHKQILTAVEAQSETRAAKAMRKHLTAIRELSLPLAPIRSASA